MNEALKNHSMLGQPPTAQQEIKHIADQWVQAGYSPETALELASAEVLAPIGEVPLLKVEAL